MNMKNNKVIIYTNKSCPYCKTVKQELDNNNIKYEERFTDEFKDEWTDIITLTAVPTVPTVNYKENYFVPARDFNNPQHLVGIIQNFKPCSLPNDIQIIEKIKTLNYNIGLAFSGTDKLLKQIESKLNINEDEHESTN